MWWYVIRGSGLAAWALASASVLAGLGMSTGLVAVKKARGLHAWLGGLTVVAVALHLVSLVADSYMTFSIKDVLVPFASSWRPGAVAWGVGALYLLVAVEGTSLLRRWLPTRAWRTVHLASFVLFWMATMHAVTAGTDLGVPAIAGIVVLTVLAVLVLLLLRIGQSVVPGARARLAKRRAAALRREQARQRPTDRDRDQELVSTGTP
jgi:predicted ferric reductase